MVLDFSTNNWRKQIAESDWEQNILDFLAEWFSDSDFVHGKSSGSTGVPKELKLSKKSMYASAMRTIGFFDLKKGNSSLLVLPIQFIGGKMQVVRAILAQLKLVCLAPSSHVKLQESMDFAALTPMQFKRSTTAWPYLKTVILGGGAVGNITAPLPNNINLYETYGMTETYSHIALRQIHPKKQRCFCALPNVSISKDERGCLIVNDERTLESPIITNDLVELNNTECFRLIGRWDNIINSGGLKISPEEVESLLNASQFTGEFLISWVPDSVLGQKVVLITKELLRSDRFDLAVSKISPKNLRPKAHFRLKEFVYTENGKIQRKRTQEKLLQQLDLLP